MSDRILIKDLLQVSKAGTKVTVKGWVRTKRDSKAGFSFIEVNDGSCLSNIQAIADADIKGANLLSEISTGACVALHGILVASPGEGQKFELKVEKIELYGKAAKGYPLQKKRHGFEFLRTIGHLRMRSNTFGAVFRVRNAVSRAIHDFFQKRNYLWIHTPLITASDCEGAGEMFRVTTLSPDRPPTKKGKIRWAKDFFGKQTFLTVSGQLAVEPFASSFPGVYTFGPTFRAENSNTTRHLSEFWMVEPEIAFADLQDDAKLAEDFLKYIIQFVMNNCIEDLEFFNKRIEEGLLDKLKSILNDPFEQLEYTKAIELLKESKKDFEFPIEWGSDLHAEHERWLTEEKIGRPVAVINYPKEIKSFYMRMNDDEKTVAAMDILVPKIGEIIGGSQREERLDVLEARIEELEVPKEEYWWYLDLRRYGTVPHAGFGLGLERMVMYLTGMANIRDVIPYARVPKSCEF